METFPTTKSSVVLNKVPSKVKLGDPVGLLDPSL
jgi:hypothetical protein